MCLAFPGKITKIKGESAIIDFDGIEKTINVSLVKVKKGDHVIVHAGFAIQKLSQKEAQEVFQIHEESGIKKNTQKNT